MKIAILLPYKENYSELNAGAVSIFVNDTIKLSKYKKDIKVYGSTDSKKVLKQYINIKFKKKFYKSSSNEYLRCFLNKIKDIKIDILEIHNRPHYFNFIKPDSNYKKILFFHNDPLNMHGSASTKERLNLLEITDKIIFNSNWSKSRFLIDLPYSINHDKLKVIHQSTSKTKVNFNKKKNIISFIGKLNPSKGYDIFGKAILKILDKYDNWKAIVIGDEPRQKIFFKHKNLDHLGFKENSFILKKLKEVSIATVPSRWNEPFGRSSLEAASRGCALILSNTGGLSETTNHALTLKEINEYSLFKKIDYLIKNPKFTRLLQKKTYNDFNLTNQNSAKLIDNLRANISINKINLIKDIKKPLKIIHITNFNERFDGRLHYNTGKRINNGLIRLGHNILNISDRDILFNYKSLKDPKGISALNNKIISTFNNFKPDMIIAGHADNISSDTYEYIKNKDKSVKIAQWFLDPVSKFGPDYIKNKNRLLKNIKFMDANFLTTDPKSINFRIINSHFIPNPADVSFETLENYKYDCENDLFFAMSHGVHRGKLKKNKSDNREKILNELLLKHKEIKFDFYGLDNRQPLWAEDFKNQLSKSKMGFNLSRGKPLKYYSSDRIAQLMGNGLLTFIDEKTSYSDFFTKNEIITYKNLDDLTEKILKFKKNDRQRRIIAKNGKHRYLKMFNSTNVANFIIAKTLELKNKKFW
jgi:glycosyltransferase involved in cell wall biosynthesis